jgi:phage tail sheath protein FI
MTGSDADFSLTLVSGSAISNLVYNASNTDSRKSPGTTTTNLLLEPALAKFTVPIAFGYDGFDVRVANPIANETQLASISQLGTQALRQAVDIIADPDFIDINMLAIPGVYSSKVVDYAINKIEDRADAFYVIDVSGSTVTAVVQEVQGRGFDTNYASVYYPSIRVNDDVNGVVKTLPASIPAIGVIAFSDRVSYPWFAPAGLNRAGLSRDTIGFDVLSITDQLKADERDTLYENRINPIARFPDVPQGVVWGQKTLQLKSSALDRINVRRLMIRAKKLIASAIKFLVFEPNNPQTQTRFRQLVNPILGDIQQKQGLTQFKVVMDETTNTPDLIDRNILAGKIFLVPTRSAEFISVDFVISKTGATFSE